MARRQAPTESLALRLNSEDVNLMEWLEEKGEATYPNIGKRTWRVPPVRFNMQKMHEVKAGPRGKGTSLVLDLPAPTDQESCFVENMVFSAFENLSDSMLKQSRDGKALFLITNFEYDNYLNKLDLTVWMKRKHQESDPPSSTKELSNSDRGSHEDTTTTKDPPIGPDSDQKTGLPESRESQRRYSSDTSWLKLPDQIAKRGELDGLILHEQAGILLLQIKATGYNFEVPSDGHLPQLYIDSVEKAVNKAGRQLLRDRLVMSYIMEDMNLLDSHMTFIVALPNLTREIFELVLEASPPLRHAIKDEFRLCFDNFLFAEEFHQEKGVYGNLHKWWTEKLSKLAKPKGFNIDMMKRIIFRTVGLLSTVSVWTCRQPRAEVRTLNTAVVETGKRFAQMVLSARQAEILKREDQFLYIWGAAGSGKTLLLSLKGRHWQRKRYGVVILNTRLGTKGRDVGHVIEKTVNEFEDFKSLTRAMRIDFDLKDDPSYLRKQLLELLADKKSIKVIFDEVTWMPETRRLLEFVKNLSKNIVIWCAGMLEEFCPEGFTSERLYNVLRCPPFVQRLLKVVDDREERCTHYNTSSARAGLSTDGPRPFFVIHSKHSQRCPPTVLPYDCPLCAQNVANFLKEKLQLSLDSHSTLSNSSKHDNNKNIRSSSHGEISFTGLSQGGSNEILSKSRSNTYPDIDESTCKTKKSSRKKKNSRKGKSQAPVNLPPIETLDTKCQEMGSGEKTDKQNSGADERRNSEDHAIMRNTNHKKRSSGSQSETCEDGGVHWKTGNLQFSDIVLPVTMPIPWHHFNERGYYCISYQALAQNMHLMGSSVFCTTLLDSGIPVKIETMCMDMNSDETENVLMMCPLGKVHGLEYKVVICMPNFCALKETADFNEGIFQAQNGPWTRRKRTSFGDELVARHPVFEEEAIKESRFDEWSASEPHNWSMIKPRQGTQEVETDQIRISTHVQGLPTDVLYCCQEGPEDSKSGEHQGTPIASAGESSCCYEWQMLPDVNSPRNGRRDSDANIAEESTSEVLQHGEVSTLKASSSEMEVIASPLPLSQSVDSYTVSVSQSALSNISHPIASTPSHVPVSSLPLPSASASLQKAELPTVKSSIGIPSVCSPCLSGAQKPASEVHCKAEKPHEKRNVNDFTEEELQALNKLSDWDKAYVLMSASRCTAQLIMVLP